MTDRAARSESQAIHPLPELPGADSDLMRLISTVFDGTATPADCGRLEQLLESPSALAVYNAVIDIEVALRWRMGPQRRRGEIPASRPVEAIRRAVADGSRRSFAESAWVAMRDRFIAAMATLYGAMMRTIGWLDDRTLLIPLLLLALAVGFTGVRVAVVGQSRTSGVRQGVAAITALEDVMWGGSQLAFNVGDRLNTGDMLAVASGLVQIIHESGARVVIEGPALYKVADASTGQLEHGRLTATLEPAAGPFVIRTPTAVVTDRGTQFGVEVDSKGTTEVRVFEGAVELASSIAAGLPQPVRLAAGDVGGIDVAGQFVRVAGSASRAFVTSVPTLAALESTPSNLPFDWDETAAVTIYRDTFADTGPLAGTTPASRGGVGDAAWLAPASGWQLHPLADGLVAQSQGTACLPFRPRPGTVYRLTVAVEATSGGNGWAAIGFVTTPRPEDWNLDHAWMLQRHDVRSSDGRILSLPNVAYAGPRQAGRVNAGDERTGLQIRTVMLDTTRPVWRAAFCVGGELVGQCELPAVAAEISHVAISLFPDTVATFRAFSLKALGVHPAESE